jgi:hypothetical protein
MKFQPGAINSSGTIILQNSRVPEIIIKNKKVDLDMLNPLTDLTAVDKFYPGNVIRKSKEHRGMYFNKSPKTLDTEITQKSLQNSVVGLSRKNWNLPGISGLESSLTPMAKQIVPKERAKDFYKNQVKTGYLPDINLNK